MHGPLALIEHGFPAIVIAPNGVVLPEMQEFIQTLKQRQAEVIAISDDLATLALARQPLQLPRTVPEWLSPLVSIIPGQLFALHLAKVRDFDPDHPRGLRKVTETR
jgi:glucosamine--fructose-6-phosphate aminotransferase (isomerizing)